MMNVFSLEAVGTAYSDSSMSLQSMAWVDAPTSMPGTQLFVWAGRVSWKLNVDLSSKVAQAFCGELRSDFLRLESLMPLQSRSRTESVMPAWAPKCVRKVVMQLPFPTSLVWHSLDTQRPRGVDTWQVWCCEIRQQPTYVRHGQSRHSGNMFLISLMWCVAVHGPYGCWQLMALNNSTCRFHTIHPRGFEASQPDAKDLFVQRESQCWRDVTGET